MAEMSTGMERLRARVRAHLDVIYGEEHSQDLVGPVIEAMRYDSKLREPEPY